MKRDPKTGAPDFYAFARGYLHRFLPTVARRSPKTIEAYRISLECLLDYLAEQHKIERAYVNFDHFDRDHLKGWLAWMIDQRHYAANTVALRLSTVKAFLTYCAAEELTLVTLSPDRQIHPPRRHVTVENGDHPAVVKPALRTEPASARADRHRREAGAQRDRVTAAAVAGEASQRLDRLLVLANRRLPVARSTQLRDHHRPNPADRRVHDHLPFAGHLPARERTQPSAHR